MLVGHMVGRPLPFAATGAFSPRDAAAPTRELGSASRIPLGLGTRPPGVPPAHPPLTVCDGPCSVALK